VTISVAIPRTRAVDPVGCGQAGQLICQLGGHPAVDVLGRPADLVGGGPVVLVVPVVADQAGAGVQGGG
jgi:hypothetical protein